MGKDLIARMGCDYRLSNEYVKNIRSFSQLVRSWHRAGKRDYTIVYPGMLHQYATFFCGGPLRSSASRRQLNFSSMYGIVTTHYVILGQGWISCYWQHFLFA